MSGHNKWSSIKHRKGAQDSKRAKIFSKIIKEITCSAKIGSSIIENNPRLRMAIHWAKSVNMPTDNIQRAIKRSTSTEEENYETIIYEGYGPHGIAVIVECLTDNKNRTAAAVRSIFSKNNGSMGAINSVQYMFNKIGILEIVKDIPEEQIVEYAIESGALDIDTSGDEFYQVITEVQEFHNIQKFLEEKNIPINNAEITMQAQNFLVIDDINAAQQIINFLDILEEHDDIQKVYSNLEIEDTVAKLLYQ